MKLTPQRKQNIYNAYYKAAESLAKLCTPEQLEGLSIEEFAQREANAVVARLPKIIATESKAGIR